MLEDKTHSVKIYQHFGNCHVVDLLIIDQMKTDHNTSKRSKRTPEEKEARRQRIKEDKARAKKWADRRANEQAARQGLCSDKVRANNWIQRLSECEQKAQIRCIKAAERRANLPVATQIVTEREHRVTTRITQGLLSSQLVTEPEQRVTTRTTQGLLSSQPIPDFTQSFQDLPDANFYDINSVIQGEARVTIGSLLKRKRQHLHEVAEIDKAIDVIVRSQLS